MINIVYAGNDLMFDGILLSTLSMARRTKEDLHIHILTMDFTHKNPKYRPFRVEQAKEIEKIIQKINPKNVVSLIDCTNEYNKFLDHNKNEKPTYSPYCVLRLLIDEYECLKGKVIYLDCDTMVVGDIKILYDIDMTNLEFRATHDYMGRFWIRYDYFNSGILLLNLDEIRKSKLFKKCCDLIRKKKMYFTDQTALYKCKTKFEFFPEEYRFNEQRMPKEDTIVKHFCKGIRYFPIFRIYNIKQWNIEKVHNFLKIHTFDEDYKIYLEYKKEKENA